MGLMQDFSCKCNKTFYTGLKNNITNHGVMEQKPGPAQIIMSTKREITIDGPHYINIIWS